MIPSFIVTGKPYEFMKWLVLVVLPAVSAAYFSLSGTLDLPNSEQVVGTLAVITTFLGTVLGISSHNFKTSDARFDGAVNMEQDPNTGKWLYNLDLNEDVDTIADKNAITFKVNSPEPGV